jgi:DNA-binding transcriptional ArsR family regulator
MELSRDTAELWASWFRALGDPTRVQMLQLLASQKRPLAIGEIVDTLGLAQSTISHHCDILEAVGFVSCSREGTSTKCEINVRCLEMFPTASDVIMGRAPAAEDMTYGCAPWITAAESTARARSSTRRTPRARNSGRI